MAWQKDINRYFSAEIRCEAANKIGMLASLSAAIAGTGTNIGDAKVEVRDGDVSLFRFEVEVKDRKHLANVVRTIRQMPEVLRVSRYQHRAGTARNEPGSHQHRQRTRRHRHVLAGREEPAIWCSCRARFRSIRPPVQLVSGDIDAEITARVREPQGRGRGRRRLAGRRA